MVAGIDVLDVEGFKIFVEQKSTLNVFMLVQVKIEPKYSVETFETSLFLDKDIDGDALLSILHDLMSFFKDYKGELE